MKTEVIITKPGILNGMTGTIVDINQSGRAMIELSDSGGYWLLLNNEYQLKQNNSTTGLKTSDTPKQVVSNMEIAEVKPEKRSYTRRDKTEVKVTKRKYNKKAK